MMMIVSKSDDTILGIWLIAIVIDLSQCGDEVGVMVVMNIKSQAKESKRVSAGLSFLKKLSGNC